MVVVSVGMNAIEWVYKQTQAVFDGQPLIYKVLWVVMLCFVSGVFFTVTFAAIGLGDWLWELTGVAVGVSVGVLIISVVFFGGNVD